MRWIAAAGALAMLSMPAQGQDLDTLLFDCEAFGAPEPGVLEACTRLLAHPDASGEDRAAALWNRSIALDALGDPLGALLDIERALAEGPHDGVLPPIANQRGTLLMKLGRHGAAASVYEGLLAADPADELNFRMMRGLARCLDGDSGGAAEDIAASMQRHFSAESRRGFQEMLAEGGHLAGPPGPEFGPEAVAALGAWARATACRMLVVEYFGRDLPPAVR